MVNEGSYAKSQTAASCQDFNERSVMLLLLLLNRSDDSADALQP